MNLACGASRLPFIGYIVGTAIAFVPLIAAIAGLGALFRRLILHPSVWNSITTIAAAIALLAIAGVLRTIVLIRQFRPAAATHRSRAEFG